MRRITSDTEAWQIQQDENGILYHYRKDYLFEGDGVTEYSLALCYGKRPYAVNENPVETVHDAAETVRPVA